jgi:hypothetical protein
MACENDGFWLDSEFVLICTRIPKEPKRIFWSSPFFSMLFTSHLHRLAISDGPQDISVWVCHFISFVKILDFLSR